MRPRLFIHIGMSKAGSTAIQTTLLHHEKKLKAINILNPTAGRHRGAHWGLFREIRDAKDSLLFPQLAYESRAIPVTVLSCEGFWFLPDDGIERLQQATKDWDVHVILYLRRPGDFLRSSYRQHIKTGKVCSAPEEFAAKVQPWLAYDYILSRWSKTFSLTVRVYDAVRDRIEYDFLALLGASSLQAERIVANATPADGATRLMLLTNKCIAKRSRRMRLNKTILTLQSSFSWLPPIDDTSFHHAGNQAAAKWEKDVLLRFLSPSDLETLIRHQPVLPSDMTHPRRSL